MYSMILDLKVRSEDLMRASNMVIGCAMEGNEQASVRGFVMVNNSAVCICPSLSVSLSLSLFPVNSVLRCAMTRGSKLLFMGLSC